MLASSCWSMISSRTVFFCPDLLTKSESVSTNPRGREKAAVAFMFSCNLGQFRAISGNFGQFRAISSNSISCNLGQFSAIWGNFANFKELFSERSLDAGKSFRILLSVLCNFKQF